MLYFTSLWLSYCITGSFYLSIHFIYFRHSHPSGIHQCVLRTYESISVLFRWFICSVFSISHVGEIIECLSLSYLTKHNTISTLQFLARGDTGIMTVRFVSSSPRHLNSLFLLLDAVVTGPGLQWRGLGAGPIPDQESVTMVLTRVSEFPRA